MSHKNSQISRAQNHRHESGEYRPALAGTGIAKMDIFAQKTPAIQKTLPLIPLPEPLALPFRSQHPGHRRNHHKPPETGKRHSFRNLHPVIPPLIQNPKSILCLTTSSNSVLFRSDDNIPILPLQLLGHFFVKLVARLEQQCMRMFFALALDQQDTQRISVQR